MNNIKVILTYLTCISDSVFVRPGFYYWLEEDGSLFLPETEAQSHHFFSRGCGFSVTKMATDWHAGRELWLCASIQVSKTYESHPVYMLRVT